MLVRRVLSTWVGVADASVYHAAADAELATLFGALEALAEATAPDAEVELAQGVLTARLPGGTYVLNKQAPTRQIWWSSPVSGPKRFGFEPQRAVWVSARDGTALRALLDAEMERALGAKPQYRD